MSLSAYNGRDNTLEEIVIQKIGNVEGKPYLYFSDSFLPYMEIWIAIHLALPIEYVPMCWSTETFVIAKSLLSVYVLRVTVML